MRRQCTICGRDSSARVCRHCERHEFLDVFIGATYRTTDEDEDTSDDE